MSETIELRKWWDLSPSEKTSIISRMLASSDKDAVRDELAQEFGISEWTIGSIMAHETMRRQKGQSEAQVTVVESVENTQNKVYKITAISGLSEELRDEIYEEFKGILTENIDAVGYDYYLDIYAISEYYDVSPEVLEQYLTRRFSWLAERLEVLKTNTVSLELSNEAKDTIRDYVALASNEREKRERRKEMAKKHHVSIYVIGAITAWKKWTDGSLKLGEGTNVEHEGDDFNPSEGPYSAPLPEGEAVKDDEIDEESSGIPTEDGKYTLGTLSTEDIDFIADFFSTCDSEDPKEVVEYEASIADIFPGLTITDIEKLIKQESIQTRGEGMGALINYNNEIKNKWRAKLKEFIDENTDAAKRKDMKVLCLPGMECLEIPLYLELGFRPENIVGVEAGIVKGKVDKEVLRRFEENAQKYGIQTRIGKLEKVLEGEETVFDVVSLDFLGPMSSTYMTIFSRIHVSDNVIIITNFQWKREDNWTKKMFIQNQQCLSWIKQWGDMNALVNPFGGINKNFHKDHAGNLDISLWEARNNGSLIAQVLFGLIKSSTKTGSLWPIQNQVAEIFSNENVKKSYPEALSGIAKNTKKQSWSDQWMALETLTLEMKEDILNRLIHWLDIIFQSYFPDADRLPILSILRTLISEIIFDRNELLSHKMYTYRNGRTPMITDCVQIRQFSEVNYSNYKHTIRFLFSILNKIVLFSIASESSEDNSNFRIVNEHGKDSYSLGRKDVLRFYEGGKIISELPVRKFIHDIHTFGNMFQKQNSFASMREDIK